MALVDASWQLVGNTSNTEYRTRPDARDILIVLPQSGLRDTAESARMNMEFQVGYSKSVGRPCAVIVHLASLMSQDANTVTELGMFVGEAQRRADEEKARLEKLVAERTAALEQLATTDVITGALNRRRFLELAEQELARAARYQHPLCLAMLDLDHFKSINDRFGHAAGDEALRAVADVVRGGLRTVDLLGRYGGEELMVALPETHRDAASIALERIRAEVARIRLTPPEAAVRVSGGIVEMQAGETLEAGLRRADAALYEAKRGGRNRLVVA